MTATEDLDTESRRRPAAAFAPPAPPSRTERAGVASRPAWNTIDVESLSTSRTAAAARAAREGLRTIVGGIRNEWRTASRAKRIGYIAAFAAGVILPLPAIGIAVPAVLTVPVFWGATRLWERKREFTANRRLRRRLARAEGSPALQRNGAVPQTPGHEAQTRVPSPETIGRDHDIAEGELVDDPVVREHAVPEHDVVDAEIVTGGPSTGEPVNARDSGDQPETWWASEEGLEGAVGSPDSVRSSEPSVTPPPAAGRNPTDLSDAQRHLVDQVKAAMINDYGIALSDGDTTAFVGTASNPALSNPRYFSPGELESIAATQRQAVIASVPEFARTLVARDLHAVNDAALAATALAELGFEARPAEVVALRPIDPGVER
jgi:hypothetical protein